MYIYIYIHTNYINPDGQAQGDAVPNTRRRSSGGGASGGGWHRRRSRTGKFGGGRGDGPEGPRGRRSASGAFNGAGGTVPKSKVQCMCCGKVFERGAMANNRYCSDGKKITDRLYHAAKAQDQVEWLADQLSTLERSMRIVSAFKARFPQWSLANTITNFQNVCKPHVITWEPATIPIP